LIDGRDAEMDAADAQGARRLATATPSRNGSSEGKSPLKKTGRKNRAQSVQHTIGVENSPPVLQAFMAFGAHFPRMVGDQAVADICWSCGAENHLYVRASGAVEKPSGKQSVPGMWKCQHCGESGNLTTFLQHVHSVALEKTTSADYARLSKHRGIPTQTLKRWGLAFDHELGCWLLPSRGKGGNVVNLTRYYEASGKKLATGTLPLALYGMDQLSGDASRSIFLCEGIFDAMALDSHLRDKRSRDRYDILAVPGAGAFKPEWCEHMKGRVVRLVFDNDQAGREGQDHAVDLLREAGGCEEIYVLNWPDEFPPGCDLNDLLKSDPKVSIVSFIHHFSMKLSATAGFSFCFTRADKVEARKKVWLCEGRIPGDSLVTLDGDQGTGKSTIARYIAAKATTGEPMFGASEASIPAGSVLYFTSEDDEATVRDIIKIHGGDLTRVYIHPIMVKKEGGEEEMLDAVKCLKGLEEEVKRRGVVLLVFDALNSFIGADHDVSSDAKARRNLTGRLHSFAQRCGVCVLAIRHWSKCALGDQDKRGLGPSSMQFICRGTMWVERLSKEGEILKGKLHFSKVTDRRQPCAKAFRLKDHGEHLREVVWSPL